MSLFVLANQIGSPYLLLPSREARSLVGFLLPIKLPAPFGMTSTKFENVAISWINSPKALWRELLLILDMLTVVNRFTGSSIGDRAECVRVLAFVQ